MFSVVLANPGRHSLLNSLLHDLVLGNGKSTFVGWLRATGVLFEETNLSGVRVLEVANLVSTLVLVTTLLIDNVVVGAEWQLTVVTTLTSHERGGVTSGTSLVGTGVVELTLLQGGGLSLGWSVLQVVWRRVSVSTALVGTLLVEFAPSWGKDSGVLVGWSWVTKWAQLLGAHMSVLTALHLRTLVGQKRWHVLLDLLQESLLLDVLALWLGWNLLSAVALGDKVLAGLANSGLANSALGDTSSGDTGLGGGAKLATCLNALLELDVSTTGLLLLNGHRGVLLALRGKSLKTSNLGKDGTNKGLIDRDADDLLGLSNNLVSWTAVSNQHDDILSDILGIVWDVVLGSELRDKEWGELLSDRAFRVEHGNKK